MHIHTHFKSASFYLGSPVLGSCFGHSDLSTSGFPPTLKQNSEIVTVK